MRTTDPTKHLQGYGRRHAEGGMLHGHIRWPQGTAPTPSGCRWCGTVQRHHGRRRLPGRGMHSWEAPTERQMLARMRARRAARIKARSASGFLPRNGERVRVTRVIANRRTAWTGYITRIRPAAHGDGIGSFRLNFYRPVAGALFKDATVLLHRYGIDVQQVIERAEVSR
jgi:hypothetical protein